MAQYDGIDPTPGSPGGLDTPPAVYCKLFGDMVTERLCVLRRQELNARGGFSCEGCNMDVEKCYKKAQPLQGCKPTP